jgi:hypothetical protein
MRRTPKPEAAFIGYARSHVNIWTDAAGGGAQPPDIGMSERQRQNSEAATARAEAAYKAMIRARDAAKAATEAKDQAVAELRAIIGADLATIDAYARATGDRGVWVRAQVPAPKTPGERGAPEAPVFEPLVQITGGIVRVGFAVAAGPGAQFLLQRRDTALDNATTDWFPLATLTEKVHHDAAIPFGLRQVRYRVRAQLSSGPASAWSNEVVFSFGSEGTRAEPATAGPAAERRRSRTDAS